jgi:cbb3-type cytochrome oxidase subunit 3
MKLRTVFLLLVLAAIAAFSALNWHAFITPTTLSLGVAEVQAPLGVVMLGITAFLTVFFLIFVVYVQASALFESRRHAQELQANRELADKAEASRFTELRAFIESELSKLAGSGIAGRPESTVMARIDRLEQDLLGALQQTENSLAAYVGEIDDRLSGKAQGR